MLSDNKNDKENARLHSLHSIDILDTPVEHSYDRLVSRCANAMNTFGSGIAMVDEERVWYKAVVGLTQRELDRKDAICALTIERGAPLVIEDTLQDDRTKDNPMVIGEPKIRSYLGIPLMLTNGDRIGTISIFDTRARKFLPNHIILIQRVAEIVVRKLELRATLKQLFWDVDNWLEAESFV